MSSDTKNKAGNNTIFSVRKPLPVVSATRSKAAAKSEKVRADVEAGKKEHQQQVWNKLDTAMETAIKKKQRFNRFNKKS
ncbi:MAG: hypothetical protein JW841_14510 [Deltaproteobacteria bacterium]|nr:hypothetical protein [Deltaproteobacteria bacterium]